MGISSRFSSEYRLSLQDGVGTTRLWVRWLRIQCRRVPFSQRFFRPYLLSSCLFSNKYSDRRHGTFTHWTKYGIAFRTFRLMAGHYNKFFCTGFICGQVVCCSMTFAYIPLRLVCVTIFRHSLQFNHSGYRSISIDLSSYLSFHLAIQPQHDS